MLDRGNLAVSTVGGVRPAATAASELPGEAPCEHRLLDWPSPVCSELGIAWAASCWSLSCLF